MKKALMLSLVAIVLVLTGCKKETEGGFNGFTINQGATLTMVQGASVRLSMKVDGDVDPVYTFESADNAVVYVDEEGVLYAMQLTETPVRVTVTGTAYVNNEAIVKTATIDVTVIDFASGLSFNDFYLMQASEDWESGKYAIYMKRRNRSLEVTDGDDATVKTEEINNPDWTTDSVFPTYTQWIHLYDTIIEGETQRVGIFQDSITRYRAWILSSDCFFDSEGSFTCAADQGAVIETFFAFMQDSKYAYVLGDREFVEDLTAFDTIRPAGVEAMPFPGYLQTGHFQEQNYLDFWNAYFNGEEPSMSDYEPFWAMYDTKLKSVYSGYDEEEGSYVGVLPVLGYPQVGGWVDLASGTGDAWLEVDAYDFTATVYGNAMNYCIATTTTIDEETGEEIPVYVVPAEMAESSDIHYTKGQVSGVRSHAPEMDNTRPMLNSALKVQMNVTSTMGAIFRMACLK